MKRIFFVLVSISIIFFSAVSCKPSGKSAAQYNNRLVRHQMKIGNLQQQLIQVFNGQKAPEMKTMLNRFQLELKAVNDSVLAMPPFDGKEDFKKQTLKYFTELGSLANNECTQVVKLYELPDSLFSVNEEKKLDEILKTINSKTLSALKSLEEEQKKFATEYNFAIAK